MVWTGTVEYDNCIVIVVGVNIGRLLQRVYVIGPAFVAAIIVIDDILIIFSRSVLLVGLVIFWFSVGDFIL